MAMSDIILRITGKSDVKTAAMQAKRDLEGSFSLKSMMGSQNDMRGVRALIRGGVVGMAKYALEEGFSIGRSLADGISAALDSKKGIFAHFLDKLTGYDKIDKKNSEQFVKDISSQMAKAAKTNSEKNTSASESVQRRNAAATQQAERDRSQLESATAIQNAWAEVDAERMNAIDQTASKQISAENTLLDKIAETRRAIELKTASMMGQVNIAADLESKIKLQQSALNSVNTGNEEADAIARQGYADQIAANEKIKAQANDAVQALKSEVVVLRNNLTAQSAIYNATRKQNDIRMMALSIDQFISDEQTKQNALAEEGATKLRNQNEIKQAGLDGVERYVEALKSGVSEAEAALTAHKNDLAVLSAARDMAAQNGQIGKVEELNKQIEQSKLLGRIETDNLNTLRLTSAELAKQAAKNAASALLQATMDRPGGRGEGTPRGIMEGILGVRDNKTGKMRPRTVADLPLQQQMDMLRDPQLKKQIMADIESGKRAFSREDRAVAEYNKALARGQSKEQLKNMAGAKILALREQAKPIARSEFDFQRLQEEAFRRMVKALESVDGVLKSPP